MSDYSFLDHINTRLGGHISKHDFALNTSASRIFPGFQDNLLMFESQKCRIQIYLEHSRVYIDISALGVSDPNLWYGVDVMSCLVSKTSPSSWLYNLPRGIPISQVIEKQLLRWQGILNDYFDKIIPLFDSKVKLYETQQFLDNFVKNFYLEQRNNR